MSKNQNDQNFNESILQLMKQAAFSSGQIMLKSFRQTKDFQSKTSHRDIVTKTDLLS